MPNALAREPSPYLQQHADNPVDWHPWSDTALNTAREQNKPILLSIGYSTCHWCHVMAHESFEDPVTAEVMNRLFINIKVDKEERPDIDRVYQTCFQLMHQRGGGWPLTLCLCPHTHIPFFSATYLPPSPRHGLPAFIELLPEIERYYREHGDEIRRQQGQFRTVFQRLEATEPVSEWDTRLLQQAVAQILQRFDPEHGGLQGAPKFPLPYLLSLLLASDTGGSGKENTGANITSGEAHPFQSPREAVHHTLLQMTRGGVFDQAGGGFFRYATDTGWQIPHFEKMLYDNGPLLSLLSEFATEDPELATATAATADWLLREMTHPDGGFYSAIDADSEGGEGRFYTFAEGEVEQALAAQPETLTLCRAWLNISAPANFEGRWHLVQQHSLDSAAAALEIAPEMAHARATQARTVLRHWREQRPRPLTDHKLLCGWNALAVIGLFDAGDRLRQPRYREAAQTALDSIHSRLWQDERLAASWQQLPGAPPSARGVGYLDDYAFLAVALERALRGGWRNRDAHWLQTVLETLLERFDDVDHRARKGASDVGSGGLLFVDRHEPQLILRDKEFLDNVTPSGNGMAALALIRAAHLFARPRWLEVAERIVQAGWSAASANPSAAYSLLQAARELEAPRPLALVSGPEATTWLDALAPTAGDALLYSPAADAPVATGPNSGSTDSDTGTTRATVCIGTQCQGPYLTLEAVQEVLDQQAVLNH